MVCIMTKKYYDIEISAYKRDVFKGLDDLIDQESLIQSIYNNLIFTGQYILLNMTLIYCDKK